ncbi:MULTISPECIES: MBL fold metallo-hydrolase [Metallosphaera]|uniref:MBL fold metallo-hydrolase n=1 Tax=Metallosphaera TaxID=41980 RepID=UPI001F05310A|nr:MBL fold metallo-hydrolase [Metallosphaera sedula]MCH1772039.1 FprA family A-type flavoprotein [Metallosphaera sedula]MCP6729851.1 FprA family A-type flavoprotein [Metallosphaera sedula]
MKVHKPYVIYEEGDHSFIWLGLDESDREKGVLTNQYLIRDGDRGALLDAGGYFVFERVLNSVQEFVKPENVELLLFSHQDPDVVGALNLWIDMLPNARIYVSELWERFLPHLGYDLGEAINDLPDQGTKIPLGKSYIEAIPAHFLHSPGNFHFYDPVSRVYFSGDMGAAIFPKDKWYLIVENFEEHVKLMEGFHRRYIPSKLAIEKWLNRIRGMDIHIIAPQHGSIFMEKDVKKFLDWLGSLDKVGLDLL